jgi:hypothetical protein
MMQKVMHLGRDNWPRGPTAHSKLGKDRGQQAVKIADRSETGQSFRKHGKKNSCNFLRGGVLSLPEETK